MENEPAGVEDKAQSPQQTEGTASAGGGGAAGRLFGRGAVALASLVGTPVAGGIVLAVNAARRGKWGGVAVALFMGLLLTYSLLGLTPYVPGYLELLLLPVGAAVMAWVAGTLQGDLLAAHAKAGGRVGGVAVALVVGLVTAGGLYGALRGAQAAGWVKTRQAVQLARVVVTENQGVRYAPPVSEEEARRVGQVLEGVGYFDKTGTSKEVVMGAEGDGRRVVVFPIDPAHAKDQQVLKAYAAVAQQMVRAGVPVPFVIRLAGPGWKTVSEFKVDVTAAPAASRPTSRPAGRGPSGLP